MRKQITVYIDEDVLACLHQEAKIQQTTIQWIIRQSLHEYQVRQIEAEEAEIKRLQAEIDRLQAEIDRDKQAAADAAAHASSNGEAVLEDDDLAPDPAEKPAEPAEPTEAAEHAAAA
jgi:uncharacterized small protein (DUF1192 family)